MNASALGADRLSMRSLMVAGAAIYGVGVAALSLSPGITSFILLFALTASLVNALSGPLCTSTVVSRWFTASRGKALGIASMGTSVGGLLIPGLFAWGLGEFGWRVTLQYLGATVLLVMLPMMFVCIRNHPDDVGVELETEPAPADGQQPDAAKSFEIGEIVRSPQFWLMGLSLGLLFAAYAAMLANISPYAVGLGNSAARGSALIMAISIAGLCGKVIFGLAADRISLRLGLWVAQGLVLLSFAVMAMEPAYPLVFAAALAMGLAAGGMQPVWGAMTAKVFGLVSYGRAMGLMGPIITLCVMPAYALVGRLVDTSGSYTSSLQLFCGILIVAAALLFFLRLEPRPAPAGSAGAQ